MAKKKPARRAPSSASPRMYGDGKPSAAAQAKAGGIQRQAPAAATSSSTSSRSPADLAIEYSYVVNDLKRLGIIASALFAVLVILGIVIR